MFAGSDRSGARTVISVRGSDRRVLGPAAADRSRRTALARTCRRVGVIGASRGSGGPAVGLDTVLAEQVAQVFKFAEQSLVFGDYCPATCAGCQLLL